MPSEAPLNSQRNRSVALVGVGLGGHTGSTVDTLAPDERQQVIGLVRQTLEKHKGRLVETDTRLLLCSFRRAADAIEWCGKLQLALTEPEAAPEEIKSTGRLKYKEGHQIGMLVHTGRAGLSRRPMSQEPEFTGDAVDWIKQLAPMIHGGQIVVTEEALKEAKSEGGVSGEWVTRHLGAHRVDGQRGSLTLIQTLPKALAGRTFARLGTIGEYQTNLPRTDRIFLGRQDQLGKLDARITAGDRLVVLKGPGGIGKTALAIQWATLNLSAFAGEGSGVWVCDCLEARSNSGIVHLLAATLNVPLTVRGLQATKQLGNAIAARGRVLILLDNFDHVSEHAEHTIGRWLADAPDVVFLVTSRNRLALPGVTQIDVPALQKDEAVELFLSGARNIAPQFDDGEGALAAISELVERVEMNPLAIILASAWAFMLSAEGILDRVAQGLQFLAGAEVGQIESRHSTLDQVVGWSWNLLRPHEQVVLAQCSVFRGGFTLEAAERVVDTAHLRDQSTISQILNSLLDKSMLRFVDSVVVPGRSGQIRFSLYQSVREFASQRLAVLGLRGAAETRHGAYFEDFANRLNLDAGTEEAARGLPLLAAELENLLCIQDRCRGKELARAGRIALLLNPLLSTKGPFDIHLKVLEKGVRVSGTETSQVQVDLLTAKAEVLFRHGEQQEAVLTLRRALELGQAGAFNVASTKSLLGQVLFRGGDVDGATAQLTQAIDEMKENGDKRGWALAVGRTGMMCAELGRLQDAERRLMAAIKAAKEVGDLRNEAILLAEMGNLRRGQGRPAEGMEMYQRALKVHLRIEDFPNQGRVLGFLGSLHLDLRKLNEAKAFYSRALAIFEQVGDSRNAGILHGNKGRIFHHLGQSKDAHTAYTMAVEILDKAEDKRFRAIFQGTLGALFHEQGMHSQARAVYHQSIKTLGSLGDMRFQSLVLARLCALEADDGNVQQANRCLTTAYRYLASVEDPVGGQAVAIHAAHIDVAKSVASNGGSEFLNKAIATFQGATQAGEDRAVASSDISSDVRLALRLLRRAIEKARAISQRPS